MFIEKKKKPSFHSPKKSQLLGGKSTPLTKKASDDGKQELEVENTSPGPSITKDKRNIQKAVVVTPSQPDLQLGMIGLENYANNCYMNVVVQILCNIHEIREYFKSMLFQFFMFIYLVSVSVMSLTRLSTMFSFCIP